MTEQPAEQNPAAPPAAEPDWKAIAEKATADLEAWKGHARDWEGKAKANRGAADTAAQREQQLAEIARIFGHDKPDPEKLAADLTATKAQAAQYARENAVLLAAGAENANAAALLDSRAFAKALESIDPSDTAGIRAAVKAAVEADTRFAVTPAAPTAPQAPAAPPAPRASAAGSFNGAPGGARQLGADDFKRLSGPQLNKAMADGLFDEYLAS